MSTSDDKAARRARAAQLRQRIDDLTAGPAVPEAPASKDISAQEAAPANARDFIAKRMRELAPKKK